MPQTEKKLKYRSSNYMRSSILSTPISENKQIEKWVQGQGRNVSLVSSEILPLSPLPGWFQASLLQSRLQSIWTMT
jgi:hypothetical protein